MFFLLFVLLVSDLIRHCLNPRCQRFIPTFFPKSFIVLALTFRSLMHFESVFMCGVREGSGFILLLVDIQLSHPLLLQRLFFLH